MPEMQKINTHCADCIFRVNNDDDKQTGCELGRLAMFQQLGTELTYNKERKSYIIPRFCNTCRDENWAEKMPDENLTVKVRDEVRITYDLIFVIEPTMEKYETVCQMVTRSISSALKQNIKPKTIFIISNNIMIDGLIVAFVKEVVAPLFKDSKVKYQVIRHHDTKDTYRELVDVAVGKSKCQYYSANTAGSVIPINTFEKLDAAINDKLMSVLLVNKREWDNRPMIVQSKIHKILTGNLDDNIENKITELAEKKNEMGFIKDWSEL